MQSNLALGWEIEFFYKILMSLSVFPVSRRYYHFSLSGHAPIPVTSRWT